MKWGLIGTLLLLTGCASKIVDYQAQPITEQQARSVIEQVLFEQPPKTRPEQVVFTPEYLVYGSGIVSTTNGFGSAVAIGTGALASATATTTTKAMQTRIYFNSIGKITLYTKRDRWTVITRNQAGAVLNSSRVDTRQKAERFVDAWEYFKHQAPGS